MIDDHDWPKSYSLGFPHTRGAIMNPSIITAPMVTPKGMNKILQWYREGRTLSQIGRELNLSWLVIQHCLRLLNAFPQENHDTTTHLPPT